MPEYYPIKGRVWINHKDNTFLGYGRIVLLERIRDLGSISAAARSMGMGYRHAWNLVDSMNRQAPAPLVIASVGGAGGGGAKLTRNGEIAIRLFWETYNNFRAFLKQETSRIQKTITEMAEPADPSE